MEVKRILVPTKIVKGTIFNIDKLAITVLGIDRILYRVSDQEKKQLEKFDDIRLGKVVTLVYVPYTKKTLMAFPEDYPLDGIHIPAEIEVMKDRE